MRNARVFLFVSAAVVLLAACGKPKAGDKCKTEEEVKCTDKANALVCTDGKWEALACRGLNGCMSMMGSPGTCTNDGFNVGEPCHEEGNPECSADKKAMLKCEGKHWKKTADCNGQHGCVSNAKGATCDQGSQEAGSACDADQEDSYSCSPDKKTELVCKGGKMVLASNCRGMHGCRQKGDEIDCDNSLAEAGDPCADAKSNPACSSDKKALLKCKGGKMVKDKACKTCTVFLDEIKCD